VVLANGQAVFAAEDATHGRELWTTDGTHGGTTLLKDIATGVGSEGFPNDSYPGDFVVLANGRAVFQAEDATHGAELWVTDGTSAGTMLVKDDFGASEFAVLPNGRAVFQANGVLWITDGTSAGTRSGGFPSRRCNSWSGVVGHGWDECWDHALERYCYWRRE